MGRQMDHSRNLGTSYIFYDRGQELRCGKDQESREATAPYAHSEIGCKHLETRRFVFGLLAALILFGVQQSCKKPETITHNYYGCTVNSTVS